MPRNLLEVKDRMLHNSVYFFANYATWHYLALLGTTWHYLEILCHEMPIFSSPSVRTWSTCIICFPYFISICVFQSFQSACWPPVILRNFRVKCNDSHLRWSCCKAPYFLVCSPTFGPCCWAQPFAEPPMPCCRLPWNKYQVSESYPGQDGDSMR